MRARKLVVSSFLVALFALTPASARAAVHTTQIADVPHAVYLTAPPADPHRVMVVAQDGKVFVIKDGVKLAKPFLDVSDVVQYGGEQGLLSIAFAPDYAESHKLYAYYDIHNPSGDSGGQIVIDEFEASTADRVPESTRRRLLTIDHPQDTNHNGGTVLFGPDGRLYAATGDGGGGNDSHHNAQNGDALLGKMLVVDRTKGGASVFALGLRNPYRFSFDRTTGDLVIADVGQGAAEEIDYSPAGTGAGVNYGWPCFEGFSRTPGVPECDPGQRYQPPVLEQLHSESGFCAIIGGYVVRDPALTDLVGRYVYGDNCQSQVRSAKLALPRVTDDAPVAGLSVPSTSGFGEDSCGHVYLESLSGPVYRLDGDTPPAPCTKANSGDKIAPRVSISRSRTQRIATQKGVVVAIRCSEACGYTATGKLTTGGRSFTLARVSKIEPARRRTRIRLGLSRAARSALARNRSGSARLTVVARDSAGNQRKVSVSVVAKR